MQITGANLLLVQQALNLALAELHNQIATCPDVVEYASDIKALEAEQEIMKRFQTRVNVAITNEQIRKAGK